MVEARAGRPQRGDRDADGGAGKGEAARARFLRRTQVSRIMVDAGLEPIAVPILEELAGADRAPQPGGLGVGRPGGGADGAADRCMEKAAGRAVKGPHTQASLYPRICSLDPLQAMSLSQP